MSDNLPQKQEYNNTRVNFYFRFKLVQQWDKYFY